MPATKAKRYRSKRKLKVANTGYESIIRFAHENADRLEKCGPVRVIMKDGKLVN